MLSLGGGRHSRQTIVYNTAILDIIGIEGVGACEIRLYIGDRNCGGLLTA